MDLDDFDEPSKAPSKPSRFAPKSKFQPKSSKQQPPPPKPEPKPKPEPAVAPNAVPPSPVVVVKKEEDSHSLSSVVPATATAFEPKKEEEKPTTAGPSSSLSNNGGDPMEIDGLDSGGGGGGGGEEEDYVVAEYDVYFTPNNDPETQLYVLQYPMRPLWRPYELDQKCTEVRMKPKSAEMEIDMSIDIDSDNYDPNAATADIMKKLTLCSSCKPTQATGYAVGVLAGKKLYLNPIRAVVQLRPSKEYLSGSMNKNIPDVAIKAEGSYNMDPAGKEKQNQPNKVEQVESWIPLKYHSSTSDLAERYLRKMVTGESNSLEFPMNPYDYLNSLCPGTAINKSKSRGPSRRSLLSLPLEERLKTWLVEGPPVQRFSVLKHLAPDDPVEDVLQVLERHARLVQGLWVAKTLLRHPKAQKAEELVRDFALLLFYQSPVVKDSKLDILGSQKSSGKAVFREIAIERLYCKDWKFKEPTDFSFLKLYPDVVEQQRKLWQDVEKRIQDFFASRGRRVGASSERLVKIGNPRPSSQPDDSAKATNGAHSAKSMKKETREALTKVLRKVFQNHQVCSFQTICQGLRNMAVSMSTLPKADPRAEVAAALLVDGPQEELQAVISEVAVDVHGVYVLKSSEHPEYNSLRSVVIDLFLGHEPHTKLKKREIIEAAKIKLQREPTNTEFQKVVSEFCVAEGGAWVLKSADGVRK